METIVSLSREIKRWLVVVVIALLLTACASKGPPPDLQYDLDPPAAGKHIVWPNPPDVPRYLHAGQLLGEINFRQKQRDDWRAGAASFFRWVVGLVAGESAPASLLRPQSGVVDAQGRVLVTDVSRQAVLVFDPVAGEFVAWEKAEGLANFVSPIGISLGPEGRVLVADAELGIVARLDSRGNPGRAMGRGVLKRPNGVAYDPRNKRIYVADTHAHDVKMFDEDGRLVGVLGQRGDGDGEFNFPTFLTFARGELYVTDTMNARIQVFSAEGKLRLVLGRRGLYLGNLVRPKGVAVDTAGNIYVIESYFDHMLVFDRNGQFLMGIGGVGYQAGKFYLPSGVWTDAKDRIFVADTFNGRVSVFQFLGGSADGEY